MTDADDYIAAKRARVSEIEFAASARAAELERYLESKVPADYLGWDATAHKLGYALALIDSLLQGGDDERIARKLFAEWRGKQS